VSNCLSLPNFGTGILPHAQAVRCAVIARRRSDVESSNGLLALLWTGKFHLRLEGVGF
jgi:hypothetical protein